MIKSWKSFETSLKLANQAQQAGKIARFKGLLNTLETCYYLEDAIKKQGPTRHEPDKVTDFVVMTGLNDSKDVRTPVSAVMNRMKQTCQKYGQRFKNAQIYVAAVAPVNPKQRNLNNQLKEYADNQGYEFVETGIFVNSFTYLVYWDLFSACNV